MFLVKRGIFYSEIVTDRHEFIGTRKIVQWKIAPQKSTSPENWRQKIAPEIFPQQNYPLYNRSRKIATWKIVPQNLI